MRNKLIDLNDHLFEQLERLNDEDLTAEQITQEVARTDAMVNVSEQIINNASVALRAAELLSEYGGKGSFEHIMPMIGGTTKAIEGAKK